MRAGLPRDYSGVAPDRGDQSAVDDWWFTVWLSRQLTLQVRPHARRVRLLRPLLPLFSYEPDNQLKMSRQPMVFLGLCRPSPSNCSVSQAPTAPGANQPRCWTLMCLAD